MSISKHFLITVAGALLASACNPEASDDTDRIQQKVTPGPIKPNNMVIQGCDAPVAPNGWSSRLVGLRNVPVNQVPSWQVVRYLWNGTLEYTKASLRFAPAGTDLFYAKPVATLSSLPSTKGWFVVTWANGNSYQTTSMNSANPNGDKLLIIAEAFDPFTNTTSNYFYVISSFANSTTSGKYMARHGRNLVADEGYLCPELTNDENGNQNRKEDFLIPIPGYRWNQNTGSRVVDNNFISFGSEQDSVGACESWGYGPWGSYSDKYDACARAKMADLCGDGRSWTTGHLYKAVYVHLFDNSSYRSISPHVFSDIEGWYTAQGATCVNTNKFRPTLATDLGNPPWDPSTNTYFNAATSCSTPKPACTSTSTGKIGIGRVCENGICP